MARRSANPPRQAAPASYIQPREEANEGSFQRFLRTEIYAPEKRAGNLSLLVGITMFAGGIVGARLFGDILIPA